jgi:hypothetical protein
MPPGPAADEISIREALDLLDTTLGTFASAVCQDSYAFWLGSGISLGRVAGLRDLIPRVLSHLQRLVVAGDPDGRYRATLDEIIGLVGLNAAERRATKFEVPIEEWPTIETIVDRLANNYARFLDLVPQGEEPDYLLWEGVDVVATYGDPSIEPDTEHLCLAILILEGVASAMPSANWDGLIERAIDTVAPGSLAVIVCVLPGDLRQPVQQTILYKFHGCAVKAGQDESTYRTWLIARLSQINRWANDAINAPIVNRLIDVAMTKRTLMLGLSAQDGNIQNIFSAAQARMEWTWPIDPPAYMFCEDRLGFDQRSLLQNVYRAGYSAATREVIHDASLIRAYAKPLLSALALYVIFSKLERLLGSAPGTLQEADKAILAQGSKTLRNLIGIALIPQDSEAILLAINYISRFMALYYVGDATTPQLPYRPISTRPVQYLDDDPALVTAGMRELSVAIGLIGLGISQNIWNVELSDPAAVTSGAFKIEPGGRGSKAFVIANTTSATRLRLYGHLADDDDAILIHGMDIAPALARSPRPRRSRTGSPGIREVSISALLAEVGTANELLQRFREELSI